MQLTGPYVGQVLSNTDPAKLGRIKATVPHVYGVGGDTVAPIGITDLPWAIPAGLPAGGSPNSGGIDWLPDPGDQVLVFFLDGEPEKPVWMWMMQTLQQADQFPLHHYALSTSKKSNPDRAGLTRYGHTFEINSGSILASTKSGYQFYLLDGEPLAFNGSITLQTPLAQSFEINDETMSSTLNVNQDCYFNIGQTWQSMCYEFDVESIGGDFNFTIGNDWRAIVGNDVDFFIGGNVRHTIAGDSTTTMSGAYSVSSAGEINFRSSSTLTAMGSSIFLGVAATEPFVLGNRFINVFNALLVWLSGHAHSNGNKGSPTGPPLTPPQPEISPLLSEVLSTVIKGL